MRAASRLGTTLMTAALLLDPGAPRAGAFDFATAGGLVPGARISKVTTLADAGPGSLRAAIETGGPRVVVFEVSGAVELASRLLVRDGQLTIAGETAPGTGIVLRGAGLNIQASDVLISHLAVYAGSTKDLARAESQDSITVYGRRQAVERVTLRHVSAGWGVDENVGVQGQVDGLTVERSLIAEGLRKGGHPKGVHSMGLLLGSPVRRVLLAGNVFAANNQRNPRVTNGNEVAILNNLVVGFGRAATHLDRNQPGEGAARIDVIGNVYRPGPDSSCRGHHVEIASGFLDSTPPSAVHAADNREFASGRPCREPVGGVPIDRLAPAPLLPAPWTVQPSAALFPGILDRAGARPALRNPIDRRIVAAIRDGSLRMIDDEAAVGGAPEIPSERRVVALPLAGDLMATAADVSAFAAWLCERRREVEIGTAGCGR